MKIKLNDVYQYFRVTFPKNQTSTVQCGSELNGYRGDIQCEMQQIKQDGGVYVDLSKNFFLMCRLTEGWKQVH